MTTSVDTPAQTDVKPCVLMRLAPTDFDTPCHCGHMTSDCTKRSDGTCDG